MRGMGDASLRVALGMGSHARAAAVMNSVLIFDVGMHKGEDTDYYLRRGFNVVGIEANPELAELCKIRFQDAIARERLHIVEGAIAPSSTEKTVTFFKNTLSVWGTIDPGWSARNASLGWERRL